MKRRREHVIVGPRQAKKHPVSCMRLFVSRMKAVSLSFIEWILSRNMVHHAEWKSS
jgi:hypothetical protein